MDWSVVVVVVGVTFVATLIRSAFGFGEALLAVPLLALVMPVEVAAPLAVLLSITVAGVIVVQDWREVHFRSAASLVGWALLGIPAGLLLLTAVAEPVLKSLLALVIIAFSVFNLIRRPPAILTDDRTAWAFGVASGVLGGAYGMNGPPLVVYGSLRGWSPRHFRATLQGYFLPASTAGMIGYALVGLWTAEVTRYYFISLPLSLVAIVLGRTINRGLDRQTFITYVHIGLLVIGMILLAQANRSV